jgi:hypothetical protein
MFSLNDQGKRSAPPPEGPARELAVAPATRYNRGMIDAPLPLMPELSAPTPAPDPAPLLEQLATLRLANATRRPQNDVLQQRSNLALLPPPVLGHLGLLLEHHGDTISDGIAACAPAADQAPPLEAHAGLADRAGE